MTHVKIEFNGMPFRVEAQILKPLSLFRQNPSILASGVYRVKSEVSPAVFATFLDVLWEGPKKAEITSENVRDYKELCKEFGYSGLDEEIAGFEIYGTGTNVNVKKDVMEMKELVYDHEIALSEMRVHIRMLEEKLEFLTVQQEIAEESMAECQKQAAQACNKCEELVRVSAERHEEAMSEISKSHEQLRTQLDEKMDKNALQNVAEEIEKLKENEKKTEEELMRTLSQREMTVTAAPKTDDSVFTSDQGPFVGIFAHLREMCSGNPHEKGLVSFSASSTTRNQPYNLVDYGWNNRWVSGNNPFSYVQCDFKTSRVSVTGYSIKSGDDCFPIEWVIEVSNDGSFWTIIDQRNCFDLVGKWNEKTYECRSKSDKLFRYVRLRQNKKNVGGSDFLALSQIEFFGHLVAT